jgi:hypothetical protein
MLAASISVSAARTGTIVTNFDIADICKTALTELRNENGDPAKLDATGELRRFQRRQAADPELARGRVDNAACIATDDPRLKGN